MNAPDREKLISLLQETKLNDIQTQIIQLLDDKYTNPRHGHFKDWKNIYQSLPACIATQTNLHTDTVSIGQAADISSERKKTLEEKAKSTVRIKISRLIDMVRRIFSMAKKSACRQ